MTRRLAVVAAFAAILIGTLASGLAHHSAAMFEEKRTVTLEGVVTKFEYTNPHSWLWVNVTGADGKVVTWGFEAEGPSTLQRAGIRPSEFPAGTKLTITGRPMKPSARTARSTTQGKASG
jgi:hypothetical protein